VTAALPSGAPGAEAEAPIPSASFEALLVQRAAAVQRLAAIHRAALELEAVADVTELRLMDTLDSQGGRRARFEDPGWLADATRQVDASIWDLLFRRSGLRTFMDKTAREAWDKDIDAACTPPLTRENVEATFRTLHARRGEFFERGVVALFRSLSWDYKSNLPQMFGKRLVLRGMRDHYGFPSTRTCDALDDLQRALHLLDGRPEPDHRQGWYSQLCSLGLRATEQMETEDAYVRLKTFKNGNGHAYLKRPDLVDRLNRIIARQYPGALPPARE
jgi:hypothetical protein